VSERAIAARWEDVMDEDAFNMEVRKFLKTVGVTAQREIEAAVHRALAAGKLKSGTKLAAKAVVTIDAVGLNHIIESEIKIA
jgi:hypothetical protein